MEMNSWQLGACCEERRLNNIHSVIPQRTTLPRALQRQAQPVHRKEFGNSTALVRRINLCVHVLHVCTKMSDLFTMHPTGSYQVDMPENKF